LGGEGDVENDGGGVTGGGLQKRGKGKRKGLEPAGRLQHMGGEIGPSLLPG